MASAITGGVWQPVRLVATDQVFINDVFIQPSISNNTATFNLQVGHTGTAKIEARVGIVVRSEGKAVAEKTQILELTPGGNHGTFGLEIPNAIYWNPSHPHLYHADVKVSLDGTTSDQWTARFGMRIHDSRQAVRSEWETTVSEGNFLRGVISSGLGVPRQPRHGDSRNPAGQGVRFQHDSSVA